MLMQSRGLHGELLGYNVSNFPRTIAFKTNVTAVVQNPQGFRTRKNPMRIAYFDCFAGISGEMLLGALLSAGFALEELERILSSLHIGEYTLQAQRVSRKELSGTYLDMTERAGGSKNRRHSNGKTPPIDDPEPTHQPASPEQILSNSSLPEVIKQTSLAIFRKLAQAEGAVASQCHCAGTQPQQTGDIVAVVGVLAGLCSLGITRVECSPIHVGSGVVYSAGGIRPALSPVATEILRKAGVPVYGSHVAGEMVTPVGAGIITTIASAFGAIPAMKIGAVGYGAGQCDLPETPNVLRLFIGDSVEAAARHTVHAARHVPDPKRPGQDTHEETVPPPADAKPFIAIREELATVVISGHQQSGRQRLAS
jgi:uncharacterized protein (DUF111 family)